MRKKSYVTLNSLMLLLKYLKGFEIIPEVRNFKALFIAPPRPRSAMSLSHFKRAIEPIIEVCVVFFLVYYKFNFPFLSCPL